MAIGIADSLAQTATSKAVIESEQPLVVVTQEAGTPADSSCTSTSPYTAQNRLLIKIVALSLTAVLLLACSMGLCGSEVSSMSRVLVLGSPPGNQLPSGVGRSARILVHQSPVATIVTEASQQHEMEHSPEHPAPSSAGNRHVEPAFSVDPAPVAEPSWPVTYASVLQAAAQSSAKGTSEKD